MLEFLPMDSADGTRSGFVPQLISDNCIYILSKQFGGCLGSLNLAIRGNNMWKAAEKQTEN